MNTESKIILGEFLADQNKFYLLYHLLMWAKGRSDEGSATHPAWGASPEFLRYIGEIIPTDEQMALVLLAIIAVTEKNNLKLQ
jgi:hypothetical protein